jgi:hypothetical protein
VVTPFSPIEWQLNFDGESISLYPSIGNWSFPCQSHYWIREDTVLWSKQFSRGRIDRLRAEDQELRQERFGPVDRNANGPNPKQEESNMFARLRRRFRSS